MDKKTLKSLSSMGKALTKMYTDAFTNYRGKITNNDDGTVNIGAGDKAVATNVACRLSYKDVSNFDNDGVGANIVTNVLKVFCEQGVDVKLGDLITITRNGIDGNEVDTVKGFIGDVAHYPTHIEFNIESKKRG